VCFAVIVGLAACTAKPAKQPVAGRKAATNDAIKFRRIVDYEGWLARDFFEDREQLALCEAVSSNDLDAIELLVKNQKLINSPGKHGFTILHWVFVNENLAAFQLLLQAGADPDLKLTQHIDGKHYAFYKNDSILFSSLRCMRQGFCLAALPYSKNPNQLCGEDNLLHVYFQTSVTHENELKQFIDQKVDVLKIGSYGYTPCHWAASKNPKLCIPLIEAGADPGIRDKEGKDICDILRSNRDRLRNVGTDVTAYEYALDWINAHKSGRQ
jgi:ankyrin repeat protein